MIGGGHAGLEGVDEDGRALLGEVFGEGSREEDEGELGLSVGAEGGEALAPVEVVHTNAREACGFAGHVDDACGFSALEGGEEEVGEEEGGEVVDGEVGFEAVGGFLVGGAVASGAVDEAIEVGEGGGEGVCGGAYGVLRGEIAGEPVDVGVLGVLGERVAERFHGVGPSSREDEEVAGVGEEVCDTEPDPPGGAGEESDGAVGVGEGVGEVSRRGVGLGVWRWGVHGGEAPGRGIHGLGYMVYTPLRGVDIVYTLRVVNVVFCVG